MTRAALALVALLFACSLASPQERAPTAHEVAAARQSFREGLAHAQADRWPEARAAFERSYALAPRPVTLLNLAGAQAETGSLVLAAESYRAFLRGEGAARHRAEVQAALARLDARIAHVQIRIEGLGDEDAIELDGAPLSRAALDGDLPLDPGAHEVRVLRDGYLPLVRPLELAEAERSELRIDATLAAREADPARAPREVLAIEPSEPDLTLLVHEPDPARGEDPLPWIVGVTIAVVAIGAGVGIGVGIYVEEQRCTGWCL